MEDINIRFVNFVILALLKKSFRYYCHCDTFCLFKYYSDWWSNCEFICNNSITIWECQKCNHFRDNENETTDINVGSRSKRTWVMFIPHKCDKMGFSSLKRMSKTKVSANVKFRGVTTMNRGLFWWGRLQGKFDRILILSIVDKFYWNFRSKIQPCSVVNHLVYTLYHQGFKVFPT